MLQTQICRRFPSQESHPPVSAVGHRACVCVCVCVCILFDALLLLFRSVDKVHSLYLKTALASIDFLDIRCINLSRAPCPPPLPLKLPRPSFFSVRPESIGLRFHVGPPLGKK